MKAVTLPAYQTNVLRAMLSLKCETTARPSVEEDGILVKMHAASCNPSDIAFIRGVYHIVKELPAIPGFEGSGVVVDAGRRFEQLIGKKVSCFVQSQNSGTWAEFFVVGGNDFVVLEEGFDMDQAAAFSVNPFTAYGMVDLAVKKGSRAIMQNAAGGQVAALVTAMAEKQGIEVVQVVRRDETAERLKSAGCKYVLNETDAHFSEELTDIATKLEVTMALDAVGGSLSGTMFNAMVEGSELISYGGLSGKRISGINEMDLIFRNKSISGFNLMNWKSGLGEQAFGEVSRSLQHHFLSGELKTSFQDSCRLDDILNGLKSYIGNMSAGKILIKP